MCKKFQDDLYKVSGSIAHIVHFDYNGRSSYRQKHYDFITTVIFVVYLKSSIFIFYINRRLIFPHLSWLDSHLFVGPVAVSLRRYR